MYNQKPMATFVIKVYPGFLNDAGYDKLSDSLNGLEDELKDYAIELLNREMPKHFADEPDFFEVYGWEIVNGKEV